MGGAEVTRVSRCTAVDNARRCVQRGKCMRYYAAKELHAIGQGRQGARHADMGTPLDRNTQAS